MFQPTEFNRQMSRLADKVAKRELVAEQLHIWYLEATKKLPPESYNPNAQHAYKNLSEKQKEIDRYIAQKVIELINNAIERRRDQE